MATINDNVDTTPYGLDDTPVGDAEKGAALGGLGGAAVGAAAGAIAGPVGAIVGAVAGGLLGAGASGAAVAAIDQVDHDDEVVTGYADDVSTDVNDTYLANATTDDLRSEYSTAALNRDTTYGDAPVGGHNIVTGGQAHTDAGTTGLAAGAIAGGLIGTAVGGPVGAVIGGTLGSLAGGIAGDASEAIDDTASADFVPSADIPTSAITGATQPGYGVPVDDAFSTPDNNFAGSDFQAGVIDNPDVTPIDHTQVNDDTLAVSSQTDYRNVDEGFTSVGATDQNADQSVLNDPGVPGVRSGSDLPGWQTGGVTTAGPDTRGLLEKGADAVTGDNIDDKTGGRVLNDR